LNTYTEDQRYLQLKQWLEVQLKETDLVIKPASADASFRRYFRVFSNREPLIAMDAPPPQENVRGFVSVANIFRMVGVHVPEIIAGDYQQGFLLLSDFGSTSYFDGLSDTNANQLYGDAFDSLLLIQTRIVQQATDLPAYDASLLNKELALFSEWFVEKLLGLALNSRQQQLVQASYQQLIDSALEQPQVCVHRDFHSRNLMLLDNDNPGVIDFQDAVFGPVTYDLVSLLRDCYVSWPVSRVDAWVDDFYQRSIDIGVFSNNVSRDQYQHWFNRMGVQRHLKAIGIFSRLNIRDDKPDYLKDIPTTLNYVISVCNEDEGLSGLGDLLNQLIIPAMQQHPEFQS
jgi:aminoglycoside/choline kinase family phosphotransferase